MWSKIYNFLCVKLNFSCVIQSTNAIPLPLSHIETDKQWCWSYYDYINIIKYGQSGFAWLNMNNCKVINKYYISYLRERTHYWRQVFLWLLYDLALHAFKLKINLQIYYYAIYQNNLQIVQKKLILEDATWF